MARLQRCGLVAIPLQSAYCAAKHAIQGFCDSLHAELIHDNSNVRLSTVHMPAVNTPQFGWVKSRLPMKAQPVPPIFQPEVAADGVIFVADKPRRELWLGWPTVKTIAGNTIVPAYGDRYLAKHGYESQQTDEPKSPDREHNLWEPVDDDRDYGAHGAFDERAEKYSQQLWMAKHRGLLGLASLVAAGAITALLTGPTEQKNDADEVDSHIRRLERRYPREYA